MRFFPRHSEPGIRFAGFTIAALSIALMTTGCAKDAASQKPRTEGATAPGGSATPVILERAAQVEGAAAGAPSGGGTLGDASYSLAVNAPASLAQGEEGVVQVVVTPKPGWKMNKEFPTKLVVTAPEGVTLTSKPSQVPGDALTFDDHNATFAIKFQAASPGDQHFTASFKFAVCTDATCDPKKQELAWAVNVK